MDFDWEKNKRLVQQIRSTTQPSHADPLGMTISKNRHTAGASQRTKSPFGGGLLMLMSARFEKTSAAEAGGSFDFGFGKISLMVVGSVLVALVAVMTT